MHQPLQPDIDQSSTSNDTTGGILSTNPTDLFPMCQRSSTLTFDGMFDLPYFAGKFDLDASQNYGTTLIKMDPFKNLITIGTGEFFDPIRPMPLVAIDACKFYDFDLKITFLAVKHERARGLIQFSWFPGIVAAAYLPSDLINHRNQKWIWDVETNEQFSIYLVGSKHAAWRSRDQPGAQPSYVPDVYTLMNATRPADNIMGGGYITSNILSPYNAGNIGPTACSVLMFYELKNLRTCEYRPPYSGVPIIHDSSWGSLIET